MALRNSPNWTLHFQDTRGVYVDRLRIENNQRLPNNDGIDCLGCYNVHITNSDFTAGDDHFAFAQSEDITVSNCTLQSYSVAVRLEDSRNGVFSNLVIHANRGIALFERLGAETHNLLFSHLVIETHLVHGHWWGKGEPIYMAISAPADRGSLRDVRFDNVIADAEAGIPLDARSRLVLSGLVLRNVLITPACTTG